MEDGSPGAICIDDEGGLGGFAGIPVCVECGDRLVEREQRIRLVQ
jgi:hypothetical protein